MITKKEAKKAYKKGKRHQRKGKPEKLYKDPVKQGFYDEGRNDQEKHTGPYSVFHLAWSASTFTNFDLDQFERLPEASYSRRFE